VDEPTSIQKMSSMERDLLGVRLNELPKLLPGLMAVGVLTWISFWLSDLIGLKLMGFQKSPVSPVTLTIVMGLLISMIVQLPKTLTPGLSFSVKKVLRFGIILLGIRLTFFDVFKLGAYGVPIVALCIFGALVITTWINSKLNLPERLGTLIAVGTSICGVTAIVAAGPAIDADEEESAYAVMVITIFGLFATLFYPYLANMIFGGQPLQVGMFLGTAVHETAQVIGAGQIYADIFSEPIALDVATITKLVRNLFMVGVIPIMVIHYSRKARDGSFNGEKTSFKKLFPVFILGFLALSVFRTFGDVGINTGGLAFWTLKGASWSGMIAFIKKIAEICLVAALAGVGLNTNFKSFTALGIKPLLVGLSASTAVGGISYLAIRLLGNFVVF
jgi:uncharacterized integral membrane protein (TIGR00698 family)